MTRNLPHNPARILSGFALLLIIGLLVGYLHPAQAQTASVDFTGSTLGASCDPLFSGAFIASATSSSGSIVNTSFAGGTAPECQSPIAIDIYLTQPASAVAFRAFKGSGSIGVDFYLGAALVTTDNIASGAPASYSRTITFDRVRIYEIAALNPIYLDDFVFTFGGTGAPGGSTSDRGFAPGDDRIAPAANARFNAYCREYGIVVYIGGTAFLVDRSFLSAEPPAINTLIAEQNNVAFYHLSDGLFQLMIAPDAEGKQEFVIFELGDDCAILRWRRGHFDTRTVRSSIYAQSAPEHWEGYPREY